MVVLKNQWPRALERDDKRREEPLSADEVNDVPQSAALCCERAAYADFARPRQGCTG